MASSILALKPSTTALRQALARALTEPQVPELLRNLMKRALVELSRWEEGTAAHGLEVALFTLDEWTKWTASGRPYF